MQRGPRGAAERDNRVHEVGVLRGPLIGLGGTHGPAHNGAQVLDPKVLGDQCMLGAHVVVDAAFGKRAGCEMVRRRGRLAVPEEGWDDDEVFLRVEGLVFSDQPEVVRYH